MNQKQPIEKIDKQKLAKETLDQLGYEVYTTSYRISQEGMSLEELEREKKRYVRDVNIKDGKIYVEYETITDATMVIEPYPRKNKDGKYNYRTYKKMEFMNYDWWVKYGLMALSASIMITMFTNLLLTPDVQAKYLFEHAQATSNNWLHGLTQTQIQTMLENIAAFGRKAPLYAIGIIIVMNIMAHIYEKIDSHKATRESREIMSNYAKRLMSDRDAFLAERVAFYHDWVDRVIKKERRDLMEGILYRMSEEEEAINAVWKFADEELDPQNERYRDDCVSLDPGVNLFWRTIKSDPEFFERYRSNGNTYQYCYETAPHLKPRYNNVPESNQQESWENTGYQPHVDIMYIDISPYADVDINRSANDLRIEARGMSYPIVKNGSFYQVSGYDGLLATSPNTSEVIYVNRKAYSYSYDSVSQTLYIDSNVPYKDLN